MGAKTCAGTLVTDTGKDGVALELIAAGTWQVAGVHGPEDFEPKPFLDLRADYGEPHGIVEGDRRR